MSQPDQRRWAPITWALFASYASTVVIAMRWLFPVPIVFSSLITILHGIECLRLLRAPLPRPGSR